MRRIVLLVLPARWIEARILVVVRAAHIQVMWLRLPPHRHLVTPREIINWYR